MSTDRLFFGIGGIFGFIGVVLGALGSHALKGQMSAQELTAFEVGVRYQMYHAFALFAIAWAYTRWPGKGLIISGWLFIAGTLLFSGSLYLMTLTGAKWLGPITPIGGLAFMAGWICMVWSIWKRH